MADGAQDDSGVTRSLDDYVDLEPDDVTAGATVVSSLEFTDLWRCDWCGEEFVIGRKEKVDCPFCPNTGSHRREPVV